MDGRSSKASSKLKCKIMNDNFVTDYHPDILSAYSNTSGTLSFNDFRNCSRNAFNRFKTAKEALQPRHDYFTLQTISTQDKPANAPIVLNPGMLRALNKETLRRCRMMKTKKLETAEDVNFEKVTLDALKTFQETPGDYTLHIEFTKNGMTTQVLDNEALRVETGGFLTREALASKLELPHLSLKETDVSALQAAKVKLERKRMYCREDPPVEKLIEYPVWKCGKEFSIYN